MKSIYKIELPDELGKAFARLPGMSVSDAKGGRPRITPSSVAAAEAYRVTSLEQLMRVVSGVAAYNPDYTVLFRGQALDYRVGSKRVTSIMPSIYRGITDSKKGAEELEARFEKLRRASDLLVQELDGYKAKVPDSKKRRFVTRRIEQWAMIQHYGICDTPLLDMTRSLRVACWFALDGAKAGGSPVLYVFGMPYMHDRIALDSNVELFQMNLMSLLPPTAERPAFQEGVLAGYEQPDARPRAANESNFARRLLAKITLPTDDVFRRSLGLERSLIYPMDDPFLPIASRVKVMLSGGDEQPAIDVLSRSILRSGEAMSKAYTAAIESLASQIMV